MEARWHVDKVVERDRRRRGLERGEGAGATPTRSDHTTQLAQEEEMLEDLRQAFVAMR